MKGLLLDNGVLQFRSDFESLHNVPHAPEGEVLIRAGINGVLRWRNMQYGFKPEDERRFNL